MQEKNQKIKCTVESCEYNNFQDRICELKQIEVQACPGGNSGIAEDESMCGSYRLKD